MIPKEHPAMIVNSYGGVIADFVDFFYRLFDTGQDLIIGGTICASACTLFSVLPNDQACIHKSVTLHFHAPWVWSERQRQVDPMGVKYLMLAYPPPLRQWIKDRGGLVVKPIEMSHPETAQYFRICA